MERKISSTWYAQNNRKNKDEGGNYKTYNKLMQKEYCPKE